MSVRKMSEVFDDTKTIGATRLVLLAIADSANDAGVCWPSYREIARKANVSRRQAINSVDWLQKNGYLHVQVRRKDEHMNKSNIFRLTTAISRGSEPTSLPTDGAGSEQAALVKSETQGSERTSPRTIINHQLTTRGGGENAPNLYTLYTDNIGMITTIMADVLRDAEKTYPPSWFAPAFEIAVKNNKRNWAYISAILDRWQRDGFMSDSRPKRNGNGKPKTDIEAMIADAEARYAE